MSRYTFSNILKAKAKLLSKTSNLKLSEAQEVTAKHYKFSNFHEFTAVAKRNPNDERLMLAALGVLELSELLHVNDDYLYYELANKLDDYMSDRIAETNALGYGLDYYDCTDQSYNTDTGVVTLSLSVDYSGDQDEDKAYHGSAFKVELIIRLRCIDSIWEFQTDDEIEVINVVNDIDKYHELDLV